MCKIVVSRLNNSHLRIPLMKEVSWQKLQGQKRERSYHNKNQRVMCHSVTMEGHMYPTDVKRQDHFFHMLQQMEKTILDQASNMRHG